MNSKLKVAVINILNLRNGFFWKHGIAVEKCGHNILLNKIRVHNRGVHNRLILEDGIRIEGCMDITFVGNDNVVHIGERCKIGKSIIRMEDDGNKISIGCDTTLGGGTAFSYRRYRNKYRL